MGVPSARIGAKITRDDHPALLISATRMTSIKIDVLVPIIIFMLYWLFLLLLFICVAEHAG